MNQGDPITLPAGLLDLDFPHGSDGIEDDFMLMMLNAVYAEEGVPEMRLGTQAITFSGTTITGEVSDSGYTPTDDGTTTVDVELTRRYRKPRRNPSCREGRSMDDNIPTLSKRQADERLFGVDVLGKVRKGDAVTSFTSVTGTTLAGNDLDADDIDLVVHSTPITEGEDGRQTMLNFTCTGGRSNTSYLVALRYVSDTEALLESVIRIDVI